jgi:diguanylate cyclase (GGDEF)-like protein
MLEAAGPRRVTFGDVLANREFRAMYVAQALSVVGDQLARIAVALLVFSRSHSPLLTALTYAVTYLPWLIGGPLLAVYADRLSRKRMMIFCDAVRALLILAVAIKHVPIAVALLVIACVSVLQPAFNAARAAMLTDVLPDTDEFATATALTATMSQLGQVLGFALGGVLVAAIHPSGAVIVDSISFVVSAAVIARGVRERGRPVISNGSQRISRGEAVEFLRGSPQVLSAIAIAYAVVAATIAPESVAVPYADAHGGGATTAGLLTAAVPLGTMLGALVLSRGLGQRRAERWMRPLALATAGVLALTAFDPPTSVAMFLWVLGGAGSAMIITSSTFVARHTPTGMRGRGFGLGCPCLAVTQGLFALLAGWIAEESSPATAVADVALPAFAALVIIVSRRHSRPNAEPVGIPDSSIPENPPISEEAIQASEETVTATTRRQPEVLMWAASGVLAVFAGLLTLLLRHHGPPLPVGVPPWWFLLLFFIVQAYPLQFEFRRTTRHVLLDSIALVLGLFFLSPLQLVGYRVAAKTVMAAIKRKSAIRVAFNATSGALTTVAAALVFDALAPAHASAHLAVWPAAVLGVVTDDVFAAAIVTWPGYVYNRVVRIKTLWPPLAFSLSVNLVNTCLGLVTAGAISYDPANAWMMAIFLVLTLAGFRTYHQLADRHAALDRLYTLVRNVGPVTSDPADLGPVMLQLRELLSAPELEIALLREADLATVVTAADAEPAPRVTVAERQLEEASLALTSAARAAGSGKRRFFRRPRTAAMTAESLAVAIGSGGRTGGLLRARTTGDSSRVFGRDDLRLMEAIAEQLGAALEKGRLIENLREAATRDSLTGLANLDTLRQYLTTMLQEESGGVVLLLDIDRFHDINDTVGHDAGDAVLVEVARRLEDATTQGSLACRVGGDQFALLIPGQSNSDLARLAALAVKSRVDGSLRLEEVTADVRLTVGMARAPEHGDDATTILRRAEIAMGTAKGSSHGIGEWEADMERDSGRRLYVLSGLRQALVDSDLTVEFQPKLILGTGEVSGFEALVRWRHPELGLVSPAEFIPLAEATGLVGALTSSVLRMALETCKRWHEHGYPVGMAVNISARSLDDPVLVGQVAALLTATGLDGSSLTLEITESSVMENPTRSMDILRQLRSLGIRLSIDDFGTGYSSLHQLRGLPVHEVKIDKTFVDHIDRDGADRAVVRAVVELCDSLGLTTVAEGVEQASQAYALETLGVKQVQGYFYGRPMPEADATAWLRQRPIAGALTGETQRG